MSPFCSHNAESTTQCRVAVTQPLHPRIPTKCHPLNVAIGNVNEHVILLRISGGESFPLPLFRWMVQQQRPQLPSWSKCGNKCNSISPSQQTITKRNNRIFIPTILPNEGIFCIMQPNKWVIRIIPILLPEMIRTTTTRRMPCSN